MNSVEEAGLGQAVIVFLCGRRVGSPRLILESTSVSTPPLLHGYHGTTFCLRMLECTVQAVVACDSVCEEHEDSSAWRRVPARAPCTTGWMACTMPAPTQRRS